MRYIHTPYNTLFIEIIDFYITLYLYTIYIPHIILLLYTVYTLLLLQSVNYCDHPFVPLVQRTYAATANRKLYAIAVTLYTIHCILLR